MKTEVRRTRSAEGKHRTQSNFALRLIAAGCAVPRTRSKQVSPNARSGLTSHAGRRALPSAGSMLAMLLLSSFLLSTAAATATLVGDTIHVNGTLNNYSSIAADIKNDSGFDFRSLENDSSMVGWWHFNEGTGFTTTNDSSGNNNNGTISGAAWNSSGRFGNALSFDGVNDYVNVPNSNSLNLNGTSATWEAWVNINSYKAGVLLLSKDDENLNRQYVYQTVSTDKQRFVLWTSDGIFQLNGQTIISLNTWHHIAAVYNGVNLTLYLDGVFDANISATGNITVPTSPNPLYIARHASSYFNGNIDEVAIYNRSLSAAEVMTHYLTRKAVSRYNVKVFGNLTAEDNSTLVMQNVNLSVHGAPQQNSSLVGRWTFDEGYGGTAYDTSENNNTGAISGAAWNSSGKFGNALQFDGVDDYVRISDSSSLDVVGTSITVEAWVNPRATQLADALILHKESGGSPAGGYIFWFANSKLSFRVRDSANTAQTATSLDAFVANTWQHVVGTYNGSVVKVYINGVENGSSATTLTIGATTQDLTIGAYWGAPSTTVFSGTIDEVAVYNRALSAAEASDAYNRGMLRLVNTSNVTLVNGTLNGTLNFYNVTDSSALYKQWYADVLVKDYSQNVVLANVTAKDNASTLTGFAFTDSAGGVRLNLTEFIDNISGKYFFSNYTLNATNSTYSNSTSVNVSANVAVTIYLNLVVPIVFTITPSVSLVGVDPLLRSGENYVRDNVTRITLYRYTPLSNVFVGARGAGRGEVEIGIYYENINVSFGGLCIPGKMGPFTNVRMRKTGLGAGGIPNLAVDLCGS